MLGTSSGKSSESYRIMAGNHIVDGVDHVNDASEAADRGSPRRGQL